MGFSRRSCFGSVSVSGRGRRVPLPLLVVVAVLGSLLAAVSGGLAGALVSTDPGAVFVDDYANGWLGNPDAYKAVGGNFGTMLSRVSAPAWEGIGLTHAGGPTVAYTQVSFDVRGTGDVAVGLTAASGPASSPTGRKTAASSSWVRVSCSFTALDTSAAWYNLNFYTVGAVGTVQLDNIQLGTGGPATDTCATVTVPSTTLPPTTVAGSPTTLPSGAGAVYVEGYVNGWLPNPSPGYETGVSPNKFLSRPSAPAWEGIGFTHTGGPTVAYTQVSFDVRGTGDVAVGLTAASGPASSPTGRKTAATSSWVRVSCSFAALDTSAAGYNLNFYTVGAVGTVELDNVQFGTGGPAVDTCGTVAVPSTTLAPTTLPPTTVAGSPSTVLASGAGAVYVESYLNGWLANPTPGYETGVSPNKFLSRLSAPAWDGIRFVHTGGPTVAYTQVSFDLRGTGDVAVGLLAASGPATSPTGRRRTATSSWVRVSCSFAALDTSAAWYDISFYTFGAVGTVELDNIEFGTGGPAVDTCAPVGGIPPTTLPATTLPATTLPATTLPVTTTVPVVAGVAKYEAESASHNVTFTPTAWQSGVVSGSGVLSFSGGTGKFVRFSANVPASGWYSIVVRYANSYAVGTRSLSVNSAIASQVSFPVTGSWDKYLDRRLDLNLVAGVNSIRFEQTPANSGDLNFDYLVVPISAIPPEPSTASGAPFGLPSFVATPAFTGTSLVKSTSLVGPAVVSANVLQIDMTSGAVATVKITGSGKTIASLALSPGSKVHNIPFGLPLAAGTVGIEITPGNAPMSINSISFVTKPFVQVTTSKSVPFGSPIIVNLNSHWDIGVVGRTFLRLQGATLPNDCKNCGETVEVLASGLTTFQSVAAGRWKAILYTNTPGETVGVSAEFEVQAPTKPLPPLAAKTYICVNPGDPCGPGPHANFGAFSWGTAMNGVPGCGQLGGLEYIGPPIPSEAWNSGVVQVEGNGTVKWTQELTYVLGGDSYVAVQPKTYTKSSNTGPLLLDNIGNGEVVRWKITAVEGCLNSGAIAFQINIPIWTGSVPVGPTTLPPVNTQPSGPTTVPIPNPPVVGAMPFSSSPNYLRLKAKSSPIPSVNDLACLGSPDGSAVQLESCGNPVLDFVSYNDGTGDSYFIKRGGKCLTITNITTDIQDPGSNFRNALKADWRACAADPSSIGSFIGDDRFSVQSFGDWYLIRPYQNIAGWNNPCLRFWGASAMVIQFSCEVLGPDQQPEQFWAPIEKAGGGTCVWGCPPNPEPPAGSHPLQEGIQTPIERASDLACLATSGTSVAIASFDSTECLQFIPRWSAGGWKLTQSTNVSICLGSNDKVSVVLKPCDATTVWDDANQLGDASFPLKYVNVTGSPNCLGGTTSAVLVTCDISDATKRWYDKKATYYCNKPYNSNTYTDEQALAFVVGTQLWHYKEINQALFPLLVEDWIPKICWHPDGRRILKMWQNYSGTLPKSWQQMDFQPAKVGTKYQVPQFNRLVTQRLQELLGANDGGDVYFNRVKNQLSRNNTLAWVQRAEMLDATLIWLGVGLPFTPVPGSAGEYVAGIVDNQIGILQKYYGSRNGREIDVLKEKLDQNLQISALHREWLCQSLAECEAMRVALRNQPSLEAEAVLSVGVIKCLRDPADCARADLVQDLLRVGFAIAMAVAAVRLAGIEAAKSNPSPDAPACAAAAATTGPIVAAATTPGCGGSLAEDEAAGGHTVERHVGRGQTWLANRANGRLLGFRGNQNVNSTEWASPQIAENARRAVLADPKFQQRISNVSSGLQQTSSMSGTYGGPGGIGNYAFGVPAGSEQYFGLGTTVSFEMKIVGIPGGGFYVETFFPKMP
jgi:Carbohydrate binding module (family 35)